MSPCQYPWLKTCICIASYVQSTNANVFALVMSSNGIHRDAGKIHPKFRIHVLLSKYGSIKLYSQVLLQPVTPKSEYRYILAITLCLCFK